jgi:hypothetical protein
MWVGPVEQGVPLPSRAWNLELRDRILKLQPLESFSTRQSQFSVYAMARSLGVKVSIRKIRRGLRVWRVV